MTHSHGDEAAKKDATMNQSADRLSGQRAPTADSLDLRNAPIYAIEADHSAPKPSLSAAPSLNSYISAIVRTIRARLSTATVAEEDGPMYGGL